jgi:Tol biopolymer transport system component
MRPTLYPVAVCAVMLSTACQHEQSLTEPEAVPTVESAHAPPGSSHRIAFSAGSVIFTIREDGTGLTRIFPTPSSSGPGVNVEAIEPVWSPAAPQRVAFRLMWDYGDSIVTHAAVIKTDGTGLTDLTPNTRAGRPVWSPDGTSLALTTWPTPASKQSISVVNADGTGLTSIAVGVDPAWSPDGERIVYFNESDSPLTSQNERGLWSIKPDGTSPIQLREVPGRAGTFSRLQFSPDGTRLAMCHRGPLLGAVTLWVMQSDGTGLLDLQISCDLEENAGPHWSPDGTRILTAHLRDIYVVAADGGYRSRLTVHEHPQSNNFAARWSRQGTRIAYVYADVSTVCNGVDEAIWTMLPNGSSKQRVTPCNPTVGPDGWISWGP